MKELINEFELWIESTGTTLDDIHLNEIPKKYHCLLDVKYVKPE